MTDRAFLVQLEGYGLTTAEICYAMPDYPALLQISRGRSTTRHLIFLCSSIFLIIGGAR